MPRFYDDMIESLIANILELNILDYGGNSNNLHTCLCLCKRIFSVICMHMESQLRKKFIHTQVTKKFPYHDTASGPRKYTHTLVTLDSEHQSRVLRKPEGKVVCTIFGSTTIQQDIGTAMFTVF